jgi:hypothetical protein
VLAGDGDQQLARERVFAAIPPAIKLARYPSLNWRVRGREPYAASSAAMTLATPAQGRKVVRNE